MKAQNHLPFLFLGSGIGLILLIFAVLFANERIIFSDTAGYLMEMVNKEGFVVPTNRFVSIFSQLLPLAGIKLELSLATVVVLYSLNFILIPIGCAVLCSIWLKQWKVAVSILLLYTLMSTHVFYYPVSEFQIGLCLLFLFHAVFLYTIAGRFSCPARVALYLFQYLLLLVIVFSHPLSMLVFVGWAIWLFLIRPQNRKALIMPFVIAIAMFLVKELFFKAQLNGVAFDEQRAEGIKNFASLFPNYFEGNLFRSFIGAMKDDYFLLPVLCIVFSFLLWRGKRRLAALALPALLAFFTLLVCVSFYQDSYNYYYEHLLLPVPFFLALAFCTLDIRKHQGRNLRFAALTLVFAVSVLKVYSGHEVRERRFAWYRQYLGLMETLEVQKATLSRDYISVDERGTYWPAAFESLLLSSLKGPDSSKTLFLVWNYNSLREDIKVRDKLAYDGGHWTIDIYNPKYFRLNKSQPYLVLDSVVDPKLLMDLSRVD